MKKDRQYIAIDLKSFYASVECVERELDPLTAHLVVADPSRTEKTICLAVSPALKAYGIPGRARLFEVMQKVREIPHLGDNLVIAVPRMALYMEYSTKIYNIYLRHVSADDIHVYSIDEVFMDVTDYLSAARLDVKEFAYMLIDEVFRETGITATAGIGTNMYLCKVAMDIVAKHIEPDEKGVRIAYLDERLYRELLWSHEPLTDFWRVGKGYANKLKKYGITTMGDIARCSLGTDKDYYNEELLYKLFGVNAELLIDHAWGYEPCTIKEVKAYKPDNNSFSSGQVLHCPYDFESGRIIAREMADGLALDLVEKKLLTNQLVLTVGYDIENLSDPERKKAYKGEVTTDYYGRSVPKHAHGTFNIDCYTSSSKLITDGVLNLYDNIVDSNLLIRRFNITVNHVIKEGEEPVKGYEQLDLFTDFEALLSEKNEKESELKKEKKMQEAMVSIKKRFGKNAIIKGTNLVDGAMSIERNSQIGGHKA